MKKKNKKKKLLSPENPIEKALITGEHGPKARTFPHKRKNHYYRKPKHKIKHEPPYDNF